jgi:hypothetical protein
MNVKRLEGPILNFWIAKSAGLKPLTEQPLPGVLHDPESGFWHPQNYHPANNWAHAGPIVSNDWYCIEDILIDWFGPDWHTINAIVQNPLIWFMRAYVASSFGNEVENIAFGDSSGNADGNIRRAADLNPCAQSA